LTDVHGSPISLRDISAEEADYSSPMDEDATTNIAIVGGGSNGMTALTIFLLIVL